MHFVSMKFYGHFTVVFRLIVAALRVFYSHAVFVSHTCTCTIYSFASWQNRLFFGGGGRPSVKRGRTHIVLGWNNYVVYLHLYIPWEFGERGSTPRGARGPSLSVCPSRYDARHRKPRRCVYALNLGGTGISPADRSPRGQKHPRTIIPLPRTPNKRRHILLQR